MKKSIARVLLPGILMGITTIAGCQGSPRPIPEEVKEEKNVVEAFGWVRAEVSKNIVLDIPARVVSILIKEGQQVTKGEPLVILDIEDFDLGIRQKQKEIQIMTLEKEKLAEAISLDSRTDPEMRKRMGDLVFVEKVYQRAYEDYKLKENQYHRGAISSEEAKGYRQKMEEKKKSLEDAKLAIEALEHERKVQISNIHITTEKITSLQDELKELEEKKNKSYLQNHQVISDMENGVVYEIGYRQGDLILPEKKICSILDLDTLLVEAEVAEEFIKDVHLGAVVTLIPLADKSREYKGEVIRIASKGMVKNGETLVPVSISIENRDDFLMPDFNVDVSIEIP
ncbi:MAG: efflux RND transporter periplasmic adaptor subunit [Thermotaleaceae bacterium]